MENIISISIQIVLIERKVIQELLIKNKSLQLVIMLLHIPDFSIDIGIQFMKTKPISSIDFMIVMMLKDMIYNLKQIIKEITLIIISP